MKRGASGPGEAQKLAFLTSEGDGWYERNRTALDTSSPMRDAVCSRIATHIPIDITSRVLEVGCGHGGNLAALASLRPLEGYGIEPSRAAVAAGSKRFPELKLRTGTADKLPYDDEFFDIVWFGFCLYLLDRKLLMRAAAEADRVLRDKGVLAIVDFDPGLPSVRPYHHLEGLKSYKMDYSQLFLANPAYVLAEKFATSHAMGQWQSDPQERIALSICRKDAEHAYRRA
jgi:SAM-dependent methyltransferase